MIAAMDKNRLIGANNKMPWHLPADLAHFKKVTMGKPILMGRKTFESIGRALAGRRNVIVTRQEDYQAIGCDIFHSLGAAFAALQSEPEVMLIGGGELFKKVLPEASTLYLTIIDAQFQGDTYFPQWDANAWKLETEESFSADEKNPYPYAFLTLKRC